MVKPHVVLDGARLRDQLSKPGSSWSGSVVPMTVREAPADGRITVDTPAGDELRVVASDGLYAEGAVVPVLVADDGRALRADPPGSLPEGSVPVGVGAGGRMLVDAHSQARRAWEEAKAAQESIVATDSSAKAAQAVADAAKQAAELNAQAIEAAKEASVAGDAQLRAELTRKAEELAKQAQEAMRKGQQAQDSADGKALVAYGPARPATVAGQKIIWFNPGGVPELFDGDVWRSVQPGDGVVKALDIGKATVGELSGMRIKAGTASVDILIMGENARWTSTGLTIYHPLSAGQLGEVSPTDWDKRSVALDLTSDGSRFLSVSNQKGEVTAFMAPTGEVSARSLTVTGEAKVDSLTVGGVALPDIIGGSGFETVGLTIIPELSKPASVQALDLVKTDPMVLGPGLYRITWNIKYTMDWAGVTSGVDAGGGIISPFLVKNGVDTRVKLVDGYTHAVGWGSWLAPALYGESTPVAWLRVVEPGEYRFVTGLHSYKSLKLSAWGSALVVERAPAGREIGHALTDLSKIKPPAPVTKTIALREFFYPWGTEFFVNTQHTCGGVFDCSFAKGKKIISIKVVGRSVVDFYDAGEGRVFNFTMGGEIRGAKIWDYGSFTLTFGATCAASISKNGRMRFVCQTADVWNKYDPNSFRMTITYQP